MAHALRLQTTGSMAVLGCFVASEVAARALAHHPGSTFLWLLNLEVFGVFEQARAAPSPAWWLFGPTSVWVALAVAATAIAAHAYRVRLATAVIGNLSFAFAICLGYTLLRCRAACHAGAPMAADVLARTDGWLVAALLCVSAPAAIAGHLMLLREVAEEARHPRTTSPAASVLAPTA